MQHANLLHQVKPTYPQLARTARVQGSVILEAIIDREGRVENLKVLSGHPLLVPAAVRGCPTMEISPDVAEWRTRGSVDAGDGELQSWSAVMAVRQRHEQFPLNKGGKGRRPWGLWWDAETECLWGDWIPAPVFTGVTFFRRNDD